MNSQKLATAVTAVLLVAIAAVSLTELYEAKSAVVFLSNVKLIGLILAALAAFSVFVKSDREDPNRRNWLILGFAFVLYTLGQSVLYYHQTILLTETPFPSVGDPLFVAYYPFALVALFSFCRRAVNSGLSLGKPLAFWWPAILVLVLSAVGLPILLRSVIQTGGTWQELLLNMTYPILSSVTLALSAVILRFGLKFRGGRVFWVWLTITTGYMLMLFGDIVFAYLSLIEGSISNGVLDFFFASAYVIISRGIFYQRSILN